MREGMFMGDKKLKDLLTDGENKRLLEIVRDLLNATSEREQLLRQQEAYTIFENAVQREMKRRGLPVEPDEQAASVAL